MPTPDHDPSRRDDGAPDPDQQDNGAPDSARRDNAAPGSDRRDNGAPPAGLPLFRRIRRRWHRWNAATETWRTGMLLGVATALTIWVVWYFTKPPCTPDNVAAGICNGGWLARYINAEILALAGGAGIAVATLKGGLDTYMLKDMLRQEREARQRAEQELVEVRAQRQEERAARKARMEQREQELHELAKERVARQTQAELELEQERAAQRTQSADLRNELREEFRTFVEQRLQAEQEERRHAMAIQQAMLDTILQLAQQRNGNAGD